MFGPFELKPGVYRIPWMTVVSFGLLSLLIVFYFSWPDFRLLLEEAWDILTNGNSREIREWVGSFGALGPLVMVLLMVVQMFLIVVPSWLLMVIAVLAYGPIWGTLISIVSVAVASTIGYGLGLLLGRHAIVRILGKRNAKKVKKETDRYGLWAVIVTRLNPLLSNDGISLLGGILRLGYPGFLGATLLGIAPLAILIAIFGSEWETMKAGLFWISLISLARLVLKIRMDRRRRGIEEKGD